MTEDGRGKRKNAHILLNVFLAVFESSLAKLRGDLSRRVVHELAIGAKDIASVPALLLIRRT